MQHLSYTFLESFDTTKRSIKKESKKPNLKIIMDNTKTMFTLTLLELYALVIVVHYNQTLPLVCLESFKLTLNILRSISVHFSLQMATYHVQLLFISP